jgi:hypothetical protein
MMQALSQFRAGTTGTTGAALCGKAYGRPHFSRSTGDAGDSLCGRWMAVRRLSPLSPPAPKHWGHGKPLCSKAAPTVPAVPTQNTGGEYAF